MVDCSHGLCVPYHFRPIAEVSANAPPAMRSAIIDVNSFFIVGSVCGPDVRLHLLRQSAGGNACLAPPEGSSVLKPRQPQSAPLCAFWRRWILASCGCSRFQIRWHNRQRSQAMAAGFPLTLALISRKGSSARRFSITDPQQVLPLAKIALKAHAFGDLEA